jgi:hypothetical protein
MHRKPRKDSKVTSTLSPEYRRATDAMKAATSKFVEVQRQYRVFLIGDEEYLLAKIDFQLAQKKFDVAFEKESRRKQNERSKPSSPLGSKAI